MARFKFRRRRVRKINPDNVIESHKHMTVSEIYENYKEDNKKLWMQLTNREEKKRTIKTLEKIVNRFESKLNRGVSPRPNGDPNIYPFPLPKDIAPADLRKWLSKWMPFDFIVTPWPCIETKPVDLGDPHIIFTNSLRPWLNSWVRFDTEFKEECREPNLIARDILTVNQVEVLKARSKRKDLHDSARMARRRQYLTRLAPSELGLTGKINNSLDTFFE